MTRPTMEQLEAANEYFFYGDHGAGLDEHREIAMEGGKWVLKVVTHECLTRPVYEIDPVTHLLTYLRHD